MWWRDGYILAVSQSHWKGVSVWISPLFRVLQPLELPNDVDISGQQPRNKR